MISYGIILYTHVGEKILFLLVKRRDSYDYVDILSGKFTTHTLQTKINNITNSERERLLKYNFDELWDDLWVNKNTTYIFKYEYAKKKYNNYRQKIMTICSNSKKSRSSTQPMMWGFPKGMRKKNESEIKCATREFFEETCLENIKDKIEIYKDRTYSEIMLGTDQKYYTSNYYLAYIDHRYIGKVEHKIDTQTSIRKTTYSDEVSKIRWVSPDEEKYWSQSKVSIIKDILSSI